VKFTIKSEKQYSAFGLKGIFQVGTVQHITLNMPLHMILRVCTAKLVDTRAQPGLDHSDSTLPEPADIRRQHLDETLLKVQHLLLDSLSKFSYPWLNQYISKVSFQINEESSVIFMPF
jgi:hypothetical protein